MVAGRQESGGCVEVRTYSFRAELLRDRCDFPTPSWCRSEARRLLLLRMWRSRLRSAGRRCCGGPLLLVVRLVMRPVHHAG